MAKSYVSIYEGGNDAVALEQKIFLKEELTRGVLTLPAGTDFIYHTGGSVNFAQSTESSPHKSGRHHNSVIKQKTETSWTLSTLFNIDSTLGAAATAEIDTGVRLLHKSMFGKEDLLGGSPVYTTEIDPSTTFSIFEVGDLWSKQAPGSFVESSNMTFPGDGDATVEWAGSSKTQLLVGIGKSVIDANAGNDITLAAGEGARFPVGAQVMIIKDDNSKSADTVADSARTVTAVVGDVVTIDGAVLADADGSAADIYLVYFEPENAGAINDPQTGLTGSIAIAGFGSANCIRSFSVNATNSHELVSYCYGEEGLGGPLFIPGGRFTAEISMELNLNQELVGFMNSLREFEGEAITLILGDGAGRHLQIEVPKCIFAIPEIAVGETGSIPVSFTGQGNQTALDEADELTLSYL